MPGSSERDSAESADAADLADPPEGGIGLALSGGGVRAALFSLGVLVGLVDVQQNRRVRHIASVSGGSIVNAAVAQGSPYTRYGIATEDDAPDDDGADADIETIAGPIAEALCRRGTFVISPAALLELAKWFAPRLAGFVGFAIAGGSVIAGALEGRDLSEWPIGWIGVGVFVSLLITLFVQRGTLQQAFYASTLASASPSGRKKQLTDLPDSETTHVFVATDLVSGEPVYFARNFVHCPAYGWGAKPKSRVATAVHASAAFPGLFPPRRFQRKAFAFQNGESTPPYHRLLKLSDGGVYNNLGTDWFDVLDQQSKHQIWAFGNIELDRQPSVHVDRLVIVNAGAASRGFRRVPPGMALRRTMSVLYDNTVRPRMKSLQQEAQRDLGAAPFVIDIRESPLDVAGRCASALSRRGSDDDVGRRRRAQDLIELLSVHDEQYWTDFARQTSTTPTKLTRAGVEEGARLMLHGYLSCLVVFHAIENAPLPERIRDEGDFLDLAGRSSGTGPSAAVAVAPAADEPGAAADEVAHDGDHDAAGDGEPDDSDEQGEQGETDEPDEPDETGATALKRAER